MERSLLSKITWVLFFSLMIFGIISAITMIGAGDLTNKFKENPKETGIYFFVLSQSYGSITPYWELLDKKIQIPYPDSIDIFGLLLFSLLALIVIYSTNIKNNFVASLLIFILFLIFGWFIWKILMYYAYLWAGNNLGLAYEQLVQLRLDAQTRADKIGIPLLVLSLFTLISMFKFLPRPRG